MNKEVHRQPIKSIFFQIKRAPWMAQLWRNFFLIAWSLKSLGVKVAEHSFSARFCWCKLARAQGFQKTNMPSTERSFYLLKTCTICVIFLYNCMQCIDGFSISLQRYVTKGNDTKNPAFLAFVCYRKNPVKCNACAVARKIETDCFSRNLLFSSDPVVRISRNLAKKLIRDHVNDLSRKIWILT